MSNSHFKASSEEPDGFYALYVYRLPDVNKLVLVAKKLVFPDRLPRDFLSSGMEFVPLPCDRSDGCGVECAGCCGSAATHRRVIRSVSAVGCFNIHENGARPSGGRHYTPTDDSNYASPNTVDCCHLCSSSACPGAESGTARGGPAGVAFRTAGQPQRTRPNLDDFDGDPQPCARRLRHALLSRQPLPAAAPDGGRSYCLR